MAQPPGTPPLALAYLWDEGAEGNCGESAQVAARHRCVALCVSSRKRCCNRRLEQSAYCRVHAAMCYKNPRGNYHIFDVTRASDEARGASRLLALAARLRRIVEMETLSSYEIARDPAAMYYGGTPSAAAAAVRAVRKLVATGLHNIAAGDRDWLATYTLSELWTYAPPREKEVLHSIRPVVGGNRALLVQAFVADLEAENGVRYLAETAGAHQAPDAKTFFRALLAALAMSGVVEGRRALHNLRCQPGSPFVRNGSDEETRSHAQAYTLSAAVFDGFARVLGPLFPAGTQLPGYGPEAWLAMLDALEKRQPLTFAPPPAADRLEAYRELYEWGRKGCDNDELADGRPAFARPSEFAEPPEPPAAALPVNARLARASAPARFDAGGAEFVALAPRSSRLAEGSGWTVQSPKARQTATQAAPAAPARFFPPDWSKFWREAGDFDRAAPVARPPYEIPQQPFYTGRGLGPELDLRGVFTLATGDPMLVAELAAGAGSVEAALANEIDFEPALAPEPAAAPEEARAPPRQTAGGKRAGAKTPKKKPSPNRRQAPAEAAPDAGGASEELLRQVALYVSGKRPEMPPAYEAVLRQEQAAVDALREAWNRGLASNELLKALRGAHAAGSVKRMLGSPELAFFDPKRPAESARREDAVLALFRSGRGAAIREALDSDTELAARRADGLPPGFQRLVLNLAGLPAARAEVIYPTYDLRPSPGYLAARQRLLALFAGARTPGADGEALVAAAKRVAEEGLGADLANNVVWLALPVAEEVAKGPLNAVFARYAAERRALRGAPYARFIDCCCELGALGETAALAHCFAGREADRPYGLPVFRNLLSAAYAVDRAASAGQWESVQFYLARGVGIRPALYRPLLRAALERGAPADAFRLIRSFVAHKLEESDPSAEPARKKATVEAFEKSFEFELLKHNGLQIRGYAPVKDSGVRFRYMVDVFLPYYAADPAYYAPIARYIHALFTQSPDNNFEIDKIFGFMDEVFAEALLWVGLAPDESNFLERLAYGAFRTFFPQSDTAVLNDIILQGRVYEAEISASPTEPLIRMLIFAREKVKRARRAEQIIQCPFDFADPEWLADDAHAGAEYQWFEYTAPVERAQRVTFVLAADEGLAPQSAAAGEWTAHLGRSSRGSGKGRKG